MSIRTKHKYIINPLDRSKDNTEFPDWLKGYDIKLYIDSKSVHKTPLERYIHEGHVDKDNIFNTPVDKIRTIEWRSYSYSALNKRLVDQNPYIKGSSIVTRALTVDLDPLDQDTFVFTEEEIVLYNLVGNSINQTNYIHLVEASALESVFCDWLKSPTWNDTHAYVEMLGGWETISNNTKNGYSVLNHEAVYTTCLNILEDCKWIVTLPIEYQYSVIERYHKHTRKDYPTIESFFEEIGASYAISDIYKYIGLPQNDLHFLDELGPATIEAIKYALMRGYVSFDTLSAGFRYRSLKTINQYDSEFAKFFIRNIIKFGQKIVDAFEESYIKYSCDNIKTANLLRFSQYARKKMPKKNAYPQVDNFLKAIENGDGLAAIHALAE
jgi:hypothetical protein